MDLTLTKRRFFTLVVTLIVLTYMAEKSRQLVGEERSSKSGKFSIFDCFDMGSGTAVCAVKGGVKLYTNSIRAGIVEKAKHKAYQAEMQESLDEGIPLAKATQLANSAGKKAGKLMSRKTGRITGPILAAGWDFFEAIYYGGGYGEATMRGAGTMVGSWAGGFEGERRMGRVGYLLGSQLGDWLGGRVGLMLYDVGNGFAFLVSTVRDLVVGASPQPQQLYTSSYDEEF